MIQYQVGPGCTRMYHLQDIFFLVLITFFDAVAKTHNLWVRSRVLEGNFLIPLGDNKWMITFLWLLDLSSNVCCRRLLFQICTYHHIWEILSVIFLVSLIHEIHPNLVPKWKITDNDIKQQSNKVHAYFCAYRKLENCIPLPLSRLLLVFDYLLRNFYDPPGALLEHVS